MNISNQCSLMQEITKTEAAIKICYERIAELEKRFKEGELAEEKRNAVDKELREVKKLLATNEEQLSKLHKHNRKTFIFAASLCLCSLFMFYIIYTLATY